MKKIFLLLLCTTCGISQELPKIIAPSPNAASLVQHVEVPISLYTGLPDINVPLYDISQKNIQVSINLSYHARGVKVAEIASSYGMGWSLNAGGVITRQIRGNADDSSTGYLSQNYYDTFFTSSTTRNNAYAAEINGNFDRMPDQFFFNFLGYSGKFIYDRVTNQPILETFDDIDIQTIGNISQEIEGFIITDIKGTKYYFGKSSTGITATESSQTLKDYTYSHDNGITENSSQAPSRITSWYLLEIIPLSGHNLIFTYDSEESITYQKIEEVAEKVNNNFVKTSYFSEIRNSQQRISRISFGLGEVNFYYNTPREDLKGSLGSTPMALTSVVVNNLDGSRVKKYLFEYEHTTSNSNTNLIQHLNLNAPESKKRLFLKSIKEQGKDDNYLPPYEFTYNSEVLPSRFSTSHDKWGYYNGKNNGDFSVFADDVTEIGGTVIDTIKVQAGILTKINYPTGGSAEYYYESNRAEFPNHLRNHIAFTQNNPVTNRYIVLDKDPIFYDTQTNEYSIPFTVGNIIESHSNGSGTVLTSIFLEDSGCTDVENYDCPYFVRIYHENSNSVYAILHKTSISTQIYSGNYVLKIIPTNPSIEDPSDGGDDFGVQLNWQEYVDEPDEIIFTGGSRIKRTVLKDGNGNEIEKNYEYKYSDGRTSGKVFSIPSYYGYGTITTQGGTEHTVYHHVLFRPANKLTLEQGNHGGYSFVSEFIGDNSESIGKNEYIFTTFYDEGNYYTPPYHLPNSNERLRGKPLKVTNYSYNDGIYNKIRETSNTYEYVFDYNERTYKEVKLAVFDNIGNLYTNSFDPSTAHNYYKIFYLSSGVCKLSNSETIDYLDNENVVNFTEYLYDYSKHYQLQRTKSINSYGEKRLTEVIYPQDKVAPLTQVEGQMILNNQFEFIESSTFFDHDNDNIGDSDELLQRSSVHYSNWHLNHILPESIETSKGLSSSEEQRLVYHHYDILGNPIEVSKSNGPHIYYVWGYDGQYPIAKIENFETGDITSGIQALIDTAVVASESDNDTCLISESCNESILRNALSDLREALPSKAMMTSYTYDPLIGSTSVTDAKGYTTYYEYDAFNRLEYIRDNQENIVQDYEYHYKAQNSN